MKNKSVIFAICGVVLIGFAALIVHNYKTKTSFKYNAQKAEELKPQQNEQDAVSAKVNEEAQKLTKTRLDSGLLKISADDFVLGDASAPVTFIEYASLSCPHCASFSRESFEKLKEEYVQTSKIKFVFRNFPLNQPALTAGMYAICQAQSNKAESSERYYNSIKVLFKTQDSWAFDEKYAEKLEAIAKLDGMSSERFKRCINDQNLQEKILRARMEAAQNLQLRSTPSFFVNGEALEGYIDYQTLKKLIDKKLAETSN
jgi:protein-disulfide isomerase